MDDKFTLREQLQGKLDRVRKGRDKKKIEAVEKELEVPPCPRSRQYLLGWFFELCKSRSYSQMGDPLSLADRDYLDWIGLRRRKPTKMEISLLQELDDVYLTAVRNSRSG